METEQWTLLHLCRPFEGESQKGALYRRAEFLQKGLREEFGPEYEITADKLEEPTDKWNFEVKVRQGLQIGAEVRMSWSQKKEKILQLDVDKSTRIGSYIAMSTLLPAFVIGVAMGALEMPPFDFTAGTKILSLVTGLIVAVPGLVLMLILRGALMGKHKEENKALKKKVFAWAKQNYVDNMTQFLFENNDAVPRKE